LSSEDSSALQTWSSLVLGALLLAYLTSGGNLAKFATVFTVCFLLLVLLFFGLVRLLKVSRESDELDQRIVKQLTEVRALSREEAEKRALRLLDSKVYRSVENPIREDSLPWCGPALQKFFCRFEIVREVKGETSLNRSQIRASTLREGFVRIGTDMDSTEIVALPNEDTVYVIDGSEPRDQPLEESFPTIYHFIVAGYSDRAEVDTRD
jgi:hypothetical protein